MVFSKARDLFSVLENFMRFFVNESCGNCTPCRAGNVVLLELLQRFRNGHARKEDLGKIDDWARMVSSASRCGLGHTSPMVMTTSKAAFPELYKNAMPPNADDLNYDFDIDRATQAYDAAVEEVK
jgi:[NiFe] hydrogenase diaphorase moiety large subunit